MGQAASLLLTVRDRLDKYTEVMPVGESLPCNGSCISQVGVWDLVWSPRCGGWRNRGTDHALAPEEQKLEAANTHNATQPSDPRACTVQFGL